MNIEIIQADYHNPQHQSALVMLLDAYACDEMGGGVPLAEATKQNLAAELAKLPQAFSLIAYVDGKPAGLANCFEAFSTFECRPLINVHDVVVLKQYRGKGVSRRMLQAVEEAARTKNCCKITLEVLSGNALAKSAYTKLGFAPYVLDADKGEALFWQKVLQQ